MRNSECGCGGRCGGSCGGACKGACRCSSGESFGGRPGKGFHQELELHGEGEGPLLAAAPRPRHAIDGRREGLGWGGEGGRGGPDDWLGPQGPRVVSPPRRGGAGDELGAVPGGRVGRGGDPPWRWGDSDGQLWADTSTGGGDQDRPKTDDGCPCEVEASLVSQYAQGALQSDEFERRWNLRMCLLYRRKWEDCMRGQGQNESSPWWIRCEPPRCPSLPAPGPLPGSCCAAIVCRALNTPALEVIFDHCLVVIWTCANEVTTLEFMNDSQLHRNLSLSVMTRNEWGTLLESKGAERTAKLPGYVWRRFVNVGVRCYPCPPPSDASADPCLDKLHIEGWPGFGKPYDVFPFDDNFRNCNTCNSFASWAAAQLGITNVDWPAGALGAPSDPPTWFR